jgi:hypothetical protein
MLLTKPIDLNGSQIDSSYEVFFDWTGNIYIKSQKTNKTYQLLVDSTNNLELIYFDNPEFTDSNISFKKMKLSTDPSSLKGKVIKKKLNDTNDNVENTNVESDDETDNLNQELYPENLEYVDNDDNESNYSDDIQDYFEFSKTNSDINIYTSDESTAIYETFIYNGSYNLHNNLMVKTLYKGYSLPYRLLIYSSGEFIIKTIGISQWYNQLSESNNEPIFINSKNTLIKLSNK